MYFDLRAMVAALSDWSDMLIGCCLADGATSGGVKTEANKMTERTASGSGSGSGSGGIRRKGLEVVRRRVIVFTDTTKVLETIQEEREEDELSIEVEASISTAATSPATSPPSPDAMEEQHGAEVQGASMTVGATGMPQPPGRRGKKGRKGEVRHLIEALQKNGRENGSRRKGGRSRKKNDKGGKAGEIIRGLNRRREAMGPDSPLRPRACTGL